MANIITCVVPNKSNGEEKLIVLTKWTDDVIKFLIIRDNRTLMVGELVSDDFNAYAEHFKKSLNEYLEETKDILSGIRQDVDFSLKDDKFYWKKKTWLLGQVIVKLSTSETDYLLDVIFFLTDYVSKISKKMLEDEKVIENLKKSNDDLTYKINELVLLKEQMELEWYRAILIVINSMKAKIREQQKELNALKKRKNNAVYDLSTDESDNEPNNKNDLTSQSILVKKFVTKNILEESVKLPSRLTEKRRKIKHGNVQQDNIFVNEKNVINDNHDKESKTTEVNQENIEIDEIKKIRENKSEEDSVSNKEADEVKDELSIKNSVNKTQVREEKNTFQVNPEPIASTSKTLLSSIGEDEETPDILFDESYCEMELKFEEEKDDENELNDKEKYCEYTERNKESTEIYGSSKEKDKEIIQTNDNKKKEKNQDKSRDEKSEEIHNEKRLILEQDSEEMVF